MGHKWFFVRCQSGSEDSIRKQLEMRVKHAGLGDIIPQILVPFERVTDLRGGKKRVVNKKLYPGYLMVQADIEDRDDPRTAQAQSVVPVVPGPRVEHPRRRGFQCVLQPLRAVGGRDEVGVREISECHHPAKKVILAREHLVRRLPPDHPRRNAPQLRSHRHSDLLPETTHDGVRKGPAHCSRLGRNLDGSLATQARVTRAIHRSHASLPKWAEDFVRTEARAGRQVHGTAFVIILHQSGLWIPPRPLRRRAKDASLPIWRAL